MTGKKFDRKVDGADSEKLLAMYRKRLDFDPPTRDVEELRILSEKISEDDKDEAQYQYYESCNRNLNDLRFRTLTGYGQCRGRLVSYKSDVIVCCCREMATLVAYGNAFCLKGRVYVPGRKGSASRHNDSVYIIEEGQGQSFAECPFCSAPVQEKVYCDEEPATRSTEE